MASLLACFVDLIHLDIQTILLILAVFLFTSSFIGQPRNLPPGPFGWPIVGNLVSLRNPNDFVKNISNLRKVYNSDIVHLKFANEHVIVVYTLDAVRKAYQSEDFEARPGTFVNDVAVEGHGIIGSSHKRWKESRRFALGVLRDFGMGKSGVEESIHEEVYHMLQGIKNLRHEAFDPSLMIGTAVSNIICKISFGQRFDYGDERFKHVESLLNENIQLLGRSQLLNFAPWCRFIPGDIFGYHRILKNTAEILEFINVFLKQHRSSFQNNDIEDFIDAAIDTQNKAISDIFTDKQVMYMVVDLFIAGTETTTSTLRWALLYMVLHPNVQAKVQKELDQVVPRSRKPRMSDKVNLPYTDAVIHEVQRLCNLTPIGLPHSNPHAVNFMGYDIPAGSTIFYSNVDISRDPRIWRNPHKFDPENFLDINGKLSSHEHFIPFSVGKRSCLGEGLAKMELFIFVTALMQEFIFEVDPNSAAPDEDPDVGIILRPKPFKILIKIRG